MIKNYFRILKNNFRILKKPHAYLPAILKAPVKFQKDRTKPVGGVKGTRYLLKIRNHSPRESQKQCPAAFLRKDGGQKCLSSKRVKSDKNKFRILKKKTHAYLQTILTAPVKFQKDRPKTVGGVKGTRYQNSKNVKVKNAEKVIKIISGFWKKHMHIFRPS